MEINGLPLHVLVIHAAVVFGPLAGLAGVLYAVVPAWRGVLRWPMVVTVAIAAVLMWVAVLSGEDFMGSARFATVQGELGDQLMLHEERGELLRWFATGFAAVALLSAWWHTRTGPVKLVLHVALAAFAVLTTVWTVLTGDAGAQAVWGA